MDRYKFNEEFYQLNKSRRMRQKIDLLLRIYSLMGFLIAILAGGYFVLTLLPFKLTDKQVFLLMVTGVGIVLAFMSRTLIIFRRERESVDFERLKDFESFSSFLNAWTRFERISKEVLEKEGDDFNRHSLRSVISRLYEDGKIDRGDVMTLEEALQARNSIVHGERPISTKIMEKITDSLVDIIKKITIPL